MDRIRITPIISHLHIVHCKQGVSSVPGVIFSICMSIGIPLLAFIYASMKKRYLPFIFGVLAFVISQVLLRIPLLQFLETHSSAYLMFRTTQPVLFAILLSLSAGVFEELARFIFMRFLMKQRDWKSGFLFGVGHGGIEAILLVGIGAVVMVFSPLISMYNVDFFISGTERFFAMMLHVGLSIIVLKGVVKRKFVYVVVAIMIHGFVNSLVGILPLFMPPTTALLTTEVSIAIIALAVFSYSLFMKRREIFK